MAQLTNLKNKRKGYKSQLTCIENFVNSSDDSQKIYLINVKLRSLIDIYANYGNMQSEIAALTQAVDGELSDTDEENLIADRLEMCIAKLEALTAKINSKTSSDSECTGASNVSA